MLGRSVSGFRFGAFSRSPSQQCLTLFALRSLKNWRSPIVGDHSLKGAPLEDIALCEFRVGGATPTRHSPTSYSDCERSLKP